MNMDFSKLMQNPDLLSYMSALGGQLGGGEGSVPGALDKMTQQMISAQQFRSLLGEWLGGGAKLTMDKDMVDIKVPQSALGEGGFAGLGIGNPGSYTGAQTQGTATQQVPASAAGTQTQTQPQQIQGGLGNLQNMLMMQMLNPSASPLNMNASLAGLTPQDIASAFQLKLGHEQLQQKRFSDVAAMLNQQQLVGQKEADRQLEIQKMFRRAPLEVPGMGNITLDEWKALDTKTKAYSYYAYDAKMRGEEVMPFNEWNQQVDEPTVKQIYDIAQGDKAFEDFYFRSKEAGAPKIDVGERAFESRVGSLAAKIHDPEFYSNVLGMVIERNKRAWYNPPESELENLQSRFNVDEERAIEMYRNNMVLKEMEQQILTKYPTAKRGKDGWYVNGELKVRYPNVR